MPQFYHVEETSSLTQLIEEVDTIEAKINTHKPLQEAIWVTIQENCAFKIIYRAGGMQSFKYATNNLTGSHGEFKMTTRASGTFEVNLIPQAPNDEFDDATLGRMSIDKKFHGDLEATSKSQMLSAVTTVKRDEKHL